MPQGRDSFDRRTFDGNNQGPESGERKGQTLETELDQHGAGAQRPERHPGQPSQTGGGLPQRRVRRYRKDQTNPNHSTVTIMSEYVK